MTVLTFFDSISVLSRMFILFTLSAFIYLFYNKNMYKKAVESQVLQPNNEPSTYKLQL